MRIALQSAFLLHHRPYRESSMLLDVFTKEHGRISLIARGVRAPRSKLRSLLQLFSPLLISWQGKTELMTLQHVEAEGIPIRLRGDCLLSGLYLNELLVRLLQKQDAHRQLYTIYHSTLLELAEGKLHQKSLRLFEKKLLDEIGYGLQLKRTALGDVLLAHRLYRFYPDEGFQLLDENSNTPEHLIFSGQSLLALASEQLDDLLSLRDAKRLMRMVLQRLLGNQSLHSRKLFQGVVTE